MATTKHRSNSNSSGVETRPPSSGRRAVIGPYQGLAAAAGAAGCSLMTKGPFVRVTALLGRGDRPTLTSQVHRSPGRQEALTRSTQGEHLGCPPCCDSQPIAAASEAAEVTATTEIATAAEIATTDIATAVTTATAVTATAVTATVTATVAAISTVGLPGVVPGVV